ncbi:hypothetical protein LTS18_002256, partial [Coniosporium uncinatum]
VLIVGASSALKILLPTIERLTELPPTPKKPEVTQETEDAIPIDVLRTLVTHPSSSIRDAAIALLCHRIIHHEDAKELVLKDLNSTSAETRKTAQSALDVVGKYTGVELEEIEEPQHQQPLFARLGPVRGLQHPPPTRRREREESPEEMALRRRRREAMVLHEGDSPI